VIDFNWDGCVSNLTLQQISELAAERSVGEATIHGLHQRGLIGAYYVPKWDRECICFPIHDKDGTVFRTHCRSPQRNSAGKWEWAYEPADPQERSIPALVFGNPNTAPKRMIFESQWDAISAIDKLDLFPQIDSGQICLMMTRGAEGTGRLKEFRWPGDIQNCLFPQNDAPGRKWRANLIGITGGGYVVSTPSAYKDVGDWLKEESGADGDNIEYAMNQAEFCKPPEQGSAPKGDKQPVGETPTLIINWPEISTTSTGSYKDHKAVYPPDSILEDYMAFVRDECEAADSFILGAILPVCAAQMGRKVRFPWGNSVKFANIFAMLAGPPGDRKSSAIELAQKIAKECLPANVFLPENFSPEALFDEYDTQKSGRPDKLWMCDDANITLTDWRQTSNGERVASRFLRLYDCGELTENFRRNKEKDKPVTRRIIKQTSTSIIFGATFNVACFQGQAIRAGLARRFLYYVAEGHGRLIEIPKDNEIGDLAEMFSRLNGLSASMDFTPEAEKLWRDYQQDNRSRHQELDIRNEAEAARLASEPIQPLKVAMIFEACVCAKQCSKLALISEKVLRLAIEHITHNLRSANFLDSVAERATVHDNSEILLAKIRKDFQARSRNGTLLVTRSEITGTYAHHSARQGAWSPNDIFLKFIPELVRQGDAQLYEKKGKAETYAFRDQG
jgi:hypothetical protein